ncbi:MAG: hypothetical protein ACM3ZE_02600, partial [Myxococcales bacterium]
MECELTVSGRVPLGVIGIWRLAPYLASKSANADALPCPGHPAAMGPFSNNDAMLRDCVIGCRTG